MMNTKSIAGLIVTNDNGQIAYSAGAGSSPLILSLVKDESVADRRGQTAPHADRDQRP
jgi:hypothetical protein